MGHPWKNRMDPIDRFWAKVIEGGLSEHRPDLGPCWVWQGAPSEEGYGRFYITSTKKLPAHRFAYEQVVGIIRAGLTIDHLCLNKMCVNPKHLEPVTIGENKRRWSALITKCVKGHPYDEANTGFVRGGRSRRCLTCHREATRQRRQRQRALVA